MEIGSHYRRLRSSGLAACLTLTIIVLFTAAGTVRAGAPDISDSAINNFLASKFQFDYTKIVDDASLRKFVDALDSQFAVIEYRQRTELVAPKTAGVSSKLGPDLERRYRELLGDGYIFKLLNEWRDKTSDPVNRAFINHYIDQRSGFMSDPQMAQQAQELAKRIGDRLYHFLLGVNGTTYTVDEAADIVFSGDNLPLARELYRQLNDSVSELAGDASRLYLMYSSMGQFVGYRNSMEYHLADLSFQPPEWRMIADSLRAVTDSAYFGWLDSLKQADHRDNIPLFEMEGLLRRAAVLPDGYFPADTVQTALTRLLTGFGLPDLPERLKVAQIDSGGFPAVAVRMYPPYNDLLLDSRGSGFKYYRRLISEYGRTLPWAYADSTLPYTLRDYPPGSEEMLTLLFTSMAEDSAFLARNFHIPDGELARFAAARRRLTVFQIRHALLYFYFDYSLSRDNSPDPPRYYMALTDTLFGAHDSSYQWIEVLVTGGLETAAKKLAHRFCWAKTLEILGNRYGGDYMDNPESGKFLIDKFCRPGRSQTIEQFIDAYTKDHLSVSTLKRRLGI
jgi:hypothetical protein